MSIEGDLRASSRRHVGGEVREAVRGGVPAEGVCLYSVLSHQGWNDGLALIGPAVGVTGLGLLLRPGADLDPFGVSLVVAGQFSRALGAEIYRRAYEATFVIQG